MRVAHGSDGGWGVEIERLLAAVAPVRIVVGASAGLTIEKELIDAAARQRIPVISMVDHYWNLWQRFAGATPRERWRYRPDVIYVPGDWCVARLRELECPVADIRGFRHPHLAGTPSPRSQELGSTVRRRLGFGDDDTVVLYVSEYAFADEEGWQWDQPTELDIEELGKELAAIAGEFSDAGHRTRLLIRPHPSERRPWEAILAGAGAGDAPDRAAAVVDRSLDKLALFSVADVAVGLNSMLLAEAARAGVPSYCRFPSGKYAGPKLSDFRPEIVELKTLQDCRAAIRNSCESLGPATGQR
ncbi:MAG TPA: hypothetical protein VIY51_19580 [Xanthobacteraceae bacterium]